MSITGTQVSIDYSGNGSATNFPIPFQSFVRNADIVVVSTYKVDDTQEILVLGVDYTISGGDPGDTVVMAAAPTSDYLITVSRVTPRTQPYDYIETGSFPAEAHEAALDRLTMIVQEIEAGATVTPLMSTAGYTRLSDQAVAASGTITVSTEQRLLKRVLGSGSAAKTCDATTPIAAGTIDGQELLLMGFDDDATLTILNSGNVKLEGDIALNKYSTLALFYDLNDAVWIETARKVQ